MNLPALILALACSVAVVVRAQDANTLITQGRAFLAQKNLTNANDRFQAALQIEPTHQTGNVFYAATRLFTLAEQPAGKAFLDRVGFAPTNRSVYQWTARIARDTNGVVLAPANMSAGEISAFLRSNVVVEIAAAADNLGRVTDTNFTLTLASNETTTAELKLDYGDVLLVRAGLKFAEYLGYTVHSWNLDAQLTSVRALLAGKSGTAENFLAQFPNLFTFATTNDLAAARLAFSNAATLYLNASDFIRHRQTKFVRLFNYDPEMDQNEAEFRTTVAELNQSLNGPIVLTLDTNVTVNLGRQFSGETPWRSFFPEFAGDGIISGTLPDATLGGLLPGFARDEMERFLGNEKNVAGLRVPGIRLVSRFSVAQRLADGRFQITLDAPDGSFFVIQVSTNLQTWVNLASATVEEGALTFLDPNAASSLQRYYRAVDRSAAISVQGTVFDLITGSPIPNAAVSFSSSFFGATVQTDSAGNYLVIAPEPSPPFVSFQLDITAPGYLPFQFNGISRHPTWAVYLPPPGFHPANDNFAQRQPLTGTSTTVTGFNVGATREAGEPGYGRGQSVWWSWTASANGAVTVDTIGSSFDTVLSAYTGGSLSSLSGVAIDDGKISFFVTVGTIYQVSVDSQYSAPAGKIVLNLRSTPPMAPQIVRQPESQSVLDGNYVFFDVSAIGTTPLSYQWRKDESKIAGATNSYFGIFPAHPSDAAAYSVVVSNAADSVTSSNAVLMVSATPTNDLFVNRLPVGLGGPVIGSNVGATREPGEPNHAGHTGGKSVWWGWTALEDGTVTLDTIGSSFDTLLAVYTGNSVSGLTEVASDDDSGGNFTSKLTFLALAGTSYWIAVDGNRGVSGSIVFQLRQVPAPTVPNDLFANRRTINSLTNTVSGSNVDATKETGEPNHAGNSGGKSVWWTWTATANVTVTVDTVSSTFDTLLAVYTGNSVSGLALVASDDDGGGQKTSRLTFSSVAGTTYQIAVDGYNGVGGDIILHLVQTTPLAPTVQWQASFGGSAFDWSYGLRQTSDGGYIIGGESASGPGGNKTSPSYGTNDFWLIRLDANGNKLWDKTFGGSGPDRLFSIHKTSDGGFILGGRSASPISGNKSSPSYGADDFWVVRVDANGNKLWDKSFGGAGNDRLYSLHPTSNGGFILGGISDSPVGGTKTNSGFGANDYWVIRIDANGNELWQRAFGGTGDDILRAVRSTSDGGVVLAGFSSSAVSGNKSAPSRGGNDIWIVRTDAAGNKLWDKSYGGSGEEGIDEDGIQQTADGGFIVGGSSASVASGNKTSPSFGGDDFWLLRLDPQGNVIWDRTFGGGGNDDGSRVIQIADGGFVIGGASESGLGGNKASPNLGLFDYWIVRVDVSGRPLWEASFGGADSDYLYGLAQTADGGFIMSGLSWSVPGGNKTSPNYGSGDVWVLKLGPE